MFHSTSKPLTKSYLNTLVTIIFLIFALHQGGQASEKEKFYDPVKGFKPAQLNLSKIMLQLAESLEHHGSPEPYIRHVIAEHKRIDAKYTKATGNKFSSHPKYLTDEELELLLSNWKNIEKKLQFEDMSRKCGVYMRHAIQSSWHKTSAELVADEKNLNERQRKRYKNLLGKKYFKRTDLPEVEKLYADGGGWDNLSEHGKEQIGMRTELGLATPKKREAYLKKRKGGTIAVAIFNEYQEKYVQDETGKVNSALLRAMLTDRMKLNEQRVDHTKFKSNEQDAIKYAHLIKGELQRRFDFVDKKLSPEGAKTIRHRMTTMVKSLAIIANSELLAGIREREANRKLRAMRERVANEELRAKRAK